jgi:hypothetical protein
MNYALSMHEIMLSISRSQQPEFLTAEMSTDFPSSLVIAADGCTRRLMVLNHSHATILLT